MIVFFDDLEQGLKGNMPDNVGRLNHLPKQQREELQARGQEKTQFDFFQKQKEALVKREQDRDDKHLLPVELFKYPDTAGPILKGKPVPFVKLPYS